MLDTSQTAPVNVLSPESMKQQVASVRLIALAATKVRYKTNVLSVLVRTLFYIMFS